MMKILVALAVVAAIIAGVFMHYRSKKVPPPDSAPVVVEREKMEVLGNSVEGRPIVAYTYPARSATSSKKMLFVGGMHGGYEWNSVLLAYGVADYLKADPDAYPDNIEVSIIPN